MVEKVEVDKEHIQKIEKTMKKEEMLKNFVTIDYDQAIPHFVSTNILGKANRKSHPNHMIEDTIATLK